MNFLIFGEFWGGQLGGMASLGVDYVNSKIIFLTSYYIKPKEQSNTYT